MNHSTTNTKYTTQMALAFQDLLDRSPPHLKVSRVIASSLQGKVGVRPFPGFTTFRWCKYPEIII